MAIQCVLCGEQADPEHPGLDGAIYEVNPRTMRKAWMHGWCFEFELEVLDEERKDVFFERIQEGAEVH